MAHPPALVSFPRAWGSRGGLGRRPPPPGSPPPAALFSPPRGDTPHPPNPGTIELRNAVAHHLRLRYGIEYDARSEVLITVGVSEALYLALTAVLDPGDEVIVPTPAFGASQPE